MDSDPRPRIPPWGVPRSGRRSRSVSPNACVPRGYAPPLGCALGMGHQEWNIYVPSGHRCSVFRTIARGSMPDAWAWMARARSPHARACTGMGMLGPCPRHGHGRGAPTPGTGIRSHALHTPHPEASGHSRPSLSIQEQGTRTRGRYLFRSRGETDRFFGKSFFHSLTHSGMADTLCPDSHLKRRKP